MKIMKIIIIIIITIIYQNFTYNVRARESSLSKAKQNDIPRIRKEKNPSRGPPALMSASPETCSAHGV